MAGPVVTAFDATSEDAARGSPLASCGRCRRQLIAAGGAVQALRPLCGQSVTAMRTCNVKPGGAHHETPGGQRPGRPGRAGAGSRRLPHGEAGQLSRGPGASGPTFSGLKCSGLWLSGLGLSGRQAAIPRTCRRHGSGRQGSGRRFAGRCFDARRFEGDSRADNHAEDRSFADRQFPGLAVTARLSAFHKRRQSLAASSFSTWHRARPARFDALQTAAVRAMQPVPQQPPGTVPRTWSSMPGLPPPFSFTGRPSSP